jgi:hypothetical protein
MWQPLPTKVCTNFADKRRSLGRYSSLADSGHGILAKQNVHVNFPVQGPLKQCFDKQTQNSKRDERGTEESLGESICTKCIEWNDGRLDQFTGVHTLHMARTVICGIKWFVSSFK